MFCFQCEQTAGGKGCMGKAGVCGKRAETADHQDGLVGALVALAQAAEKNPSAKPPTSSFSTGFSPPSQMSASTTTPFR